MPTHSLHPHLCILRQDYISTRTIHNRLRLSSDRSLAPNIMANSIVSLVLLLIAVTVLAVVGFVAWSIAHEVGHKTRQKLEKKHVSFSRQGMKVGVKEVTVEQQEDATQSVITKIWNHSSWPGYKSRLGWGQAGTPSAEKRDPYSQSSTTQTPPLSRHGSSQNYISRTTSVQTKPPPS